MTIVIIVLLVLGSYIGISLALLHFYPYSHYEYGPDSLQDLKQNFKTLQDLSDLDLKIKNNPDSLELRRAYLQAVFYIFPDEKDSDKALEHATWVIKNKPENTAAVFDVSTIVLSHRRLPELLRIFNKLWQINVQDKNNYELRILNAAIFFRHIDFEACYSYCSAAIEKEILDPDIFRMRAMCRLFRANKDPKNSKYLLTDFNRYMRIPWGSYEFHKFLMLKKKYGGWIWQGKLICKAILYCYGKVAKRGGIHSNFDLSFWGNFALDANDVGLAKKIERRIQKTLPDAEIDETHPILLSSSYNFLGRLAIIEKDIELLESVLAKKVKVPITAEYELTTYDQDLINAMVRSGMIEKAVSYMEARAGAQIELPGIKHDIELVKNGKLIGKQEV